MMAEQVHAAADFDWITEAMTLWLINLLEDNAADRIKDSFPDFSRTITVDNEIVSCVTSSVDDAGSVIFNLTLASATGTTGGGTNTTGTEGTYTTETGTIGGTNTTGTRIGGTLFKASGQTTVVQ
jgi:hypothetical protein